MRELLPSFIDMASEIDSLDYAIIDIDSKNMIFSKNKKIYFVDHDGITPKGIAFLRDCYPYSGNRDIKRLNMMFLLKSII